MTSQSTLKTPMRREPVSESEALLYLSQQATRPKVRRWLAEAGSAQAAYVRHGEPPGWPPDALAVTGIRVATPVDDAYPEPLRHIPDPPLALYYLGDLTAAQGPGIALVGARRGTRLGSRIAQAMGRELAAQGARVISGLARGIDGAAHQGALASGEAGCAWAVLGSGLNNIYPREHQELARRIVGSGGAVISEYPPDAPPYRSHFPERNRLISGLAEAVVVVEASRRSGSLITARMAAEQGREVFAVPGAVGNAVSAGCHWLIRQGAGLVESAEDVLMELGYAARDSDSPTPPPEALAPVFDAVSAAASSIDEIALAVGLPVEAVIGDLVQLELKGFVQLTPDGYIRVPR